MARSFKIAMTGVERLDKKLKRISEGGGAGSVNKAMRTATRSAVKDIVLPKVRSQIPVDTGFLESQLTVKSIERSKTKMGHKVGFKDLLFQGETFYGGFHEFGYVLPGGTAVPGDSFLRPPLYDSEAQVRRAIIAGIRAWIKSATGIRGLINRVRR